jgi:hypothetical protein
VEFREEYALDIQHSARFFAPLKGVLPTSDLLKLDFGLPFDKKELERLSSIEDLRPATEEEKKEWEEQLEVRRLEYEENTGVTVDAPDSGELVEISSAPCYDKDLFKAMGLEL